MNRNKDPIPQAKHSDLRWVQLIDWHRVWNTREHFILRHKMTSLVLK